ncbi:Protein LONG AFTER FAR-RED 3, partial [Frankliniella fusca]
MAGSVAGAASRPPCGRARRLLKFRAMSLSTDGGVREVPVEVRRERPHRRSQQQLSSGRVVFTRCPRMELNRGTGTARCPTQHPR